MDLCNRSIIRSLMEESGIGFRKDLGQNFLVSPSVPQDCAYGCEADTDTMILEIGPGIGCLTQELAKRFRHVLAIEVDERLPAILAKTLAEYDNVTVVCADAMKADIASLIEQTKAEHSLPADLPVAVCANLPYYITTPILMMLVESGIPFKSVTVMVQAEVAQRLCAAPGSAEYGAITVALNYYGTVKRLFTVPAGCFMPQPKVNSAVVRLAFYETKPYLPANEKIFFATVRAAFEQRRKTLLNALSSGFPTLSKEEIAAAIEGCGLDVRIRGERLSVKEFVSLSDKIAALL
ncbi:MAG: 16S rRNA (adenine(1518)-N(6)/adenine(1519)-N(6))-dimethyltransferase RsmA [Clostridia bacterium]|nr:16S rRNA (adenine(1518)-N(6)/adenine(1519)-N(6))-dimethyltransferase RsmA [Clostridia bacterium]